MTFKAERIVIALGGNAISGDIRAQFKSSQESMEHVAELVSKGFDRILITHGNGPQVGNVLLRSEIASKVLYPLPLDTCVSDTQGGMGYMIQQVLTNSLARRKINNKPVATVITQVKIDPDDPAMNVPTKPIGKYYSHEEALTIMAERDWKMIEDSGRGWRRVVPSPRPMKIIEVESIKELFEKKHLVIACGGGGIPVASDASGKLTGIEAVIDKDLTSALLANEIGADTLIIITGVEFAYINFNSLKQRELKNITASEIEDYLQKGEFAEGSMKPKIQACLNFLRGGGKRAIITSITNCLNATEGKTGTQITI